MNLKLVVAEKEYAELRRVMDCVNSHPFVDGKFTKIKCGDFYLGEREHPILICEGDAFFKTEDGKYPLELARNHLGPKGYMSDKGIYLCVRNIYDRSNTTSRRIYDGILYELVFKHTTENLIFDAAIFRLGCHPLEGQDIEKQVCEFFAQAGSIIRLVNGPEVREKVKDLEKTLSLTE